jgi:hypothetical protein
MTPSNRKLLARIKAKLTEPPRSKVGNWVIGLSGQLIWDAWDFPEPTEDEAAATRTALSRRLEEMAAKLRASPDYAPPTPAQLEEGRRAFAGLAEKLDAEKAAVRAFTAKVERERAERAAGS